MPCGNRGYPSEDGRTRRFTDSQCYGLGGIVFPNGYCHYIEGGVGGSYSVDCAYLNQNTFDWFNRQPLWVQIGGTAAVLGAGWYGYGAIKNRRSV